MAKLVSDLAKDFGNFDFKRACRKERDGRMRTRLLALAYLKSGMQLKDVASFTFSSEVSIRKWAKAFAEGGYTALIEQAGRGRQKKLLKALEAQVKNDILELQQNREGGRIIGKDVQTLLLEKYGIKYCLNSTYILMDRLNLSWISCRSKHPKTSQEAIDTFKSNFPDIAMKIKEEIKDKKIEIWWQDEMRVGQQGSLSRIWAEKGTRPRVVRQRQFLSTYIFGACCPEKDRAFALILPRVDTGMMQLYLREFSDQIDPDSHAIILMDRASWHTTEKLIPPGNISFIPLPPYSPELNPVEQLWQQLRKIKLSNTSYKNYEVIVDAACEAWNMFVEEEGNVKKLCSRDWATIER